MEQGGGGLERQGRRRKSERVLGATQINIQSTKNLIYFGVNFSATEERSWLRGNHSFDVASLNSWCHSPSHTIAALGNNGMEWTKNFFFFFFLMLFFVFVILRNATVVISHVGAHANAY